MSFQSPGFVTLTLEDDHTGCFFSVVPFHSFIRSRTMTLERAQIFFRNPALLRRHALRTSVRTNIFLVDTPAYSSWSCSAACRSWRGYLTCSHLARPLPLLLLPSFLLHHFHGLVPPVATPMTLCAGISIFFFLFLADVLLLFPELLVRAVPTIATHASRRSWTILSGHVKVWTIMSRPIQLRV